MPVLTFDPVTAEDAIYNLNLRHQDVLGEAIVKITKLGNTDDNLAKAVGYYDDLTQCLIVKRTISLEEDVTGWKSSAASAGLFPKVGDAMMLVFVRAHPVDTTRIIRNEFMILAPLPAIYSGTIAGAYPIPDLEADMATTTPTAVQKLGALINWLESAMVIKVGPTYYVGGWEYSPANSVCAGLPKKYDGSPVS